MAEKSCIVQFPGNVLKLLCSCIKRLAVTIRSSLLLKIIYKYTENDTSICKIYLQMLFKMPSYESLGYLKSLLFWGRMK